MKKFRRWWRLRRYPPVKRHLTGTSLVHLEECIANLRAAEPKDRAIALDGLAYVAGAVMDDAALEWERIIGRKWERYVD